MSSAEQLSLWDSATESLPMLTIELQSLSVAFIIEIVLN